MKIAIFGASGWIGGTVLREALERGHTVTAVVRDPARLKVVHERLTIAVGDAADADQVAAAVRGHDAVIASVGGRREKRHEVVPAAARALLAGLARAGVRRLLWVGGAGSLEVAPGRRLVDTPGFPAEYREEALAQAEALEIFRNAAGEIEWSFLSPPAHIEPGQRTGRYRIGGDRLLQDDQGESRISVEDYAVALVDELERPAHIRRRFTVAY